MTHPADPWPAPRPTGPVHGTVRVPGSKSLTNRYLVLAALAEGPSRLRGVLDSRDSRLMIQALTALGASITDVAPGTVEVVPVPDGGPRPPAEGLTIDCGLAGTVMRFVPPLAALASGAVRFTGDEAALVRPMGPILDGLAALGVRVDGPGTGSGTLPFTVHGRGTDTAGALGARRREVEDGVEDGVEGGRIEVDASGSSQFISALLLVAPRFRRGLHLVHTGASVPSPEHIGMTVAVLRRCGVSVDDSVPGQWKVSPGPIRALDTAVEPDLSNAGPFLAVAVATGGTVSVPDWPAETTQIGDRWRSILPAFGATVEFSPAAADGGTTGTLTVTGSHGADGRPRITGPGEIHGTAELAPTAAALCLLADGPGRLTGIGHLRGHETDRLTALATETQRLGGTVEEGPDYLAFPGTADGPVGPGGSGGAGPLHGATLETYEDHRMATFAAVVGVAVPDVSVRDIATTAKTMPDFPRMWTDLVVGRDGSGT